MENFLTWLLVMGVALGCLALLLFVPNYVSSYRRLSRAGAPTPGLIIWKRGIGVFFGGGQSTGSIPPSVGGLERLKDSLVWLEWDIRWVDAGTGFGRVREVIQKPDGIALVIQLFAPIRFVLNEDEANEVIFEPSSTISFVGRNRFSSVRGSLKGPDESQWAQYRGVITCELVTLGKSEHNHGIQPIAQKTGSG
jgi:hypothetical protein